MNVEPEPHALHVAKLVPNKTPQKIASQKKQQ